MWEGPPPRTPPPSYPHLFLCFYISNPQSCPTPCTTTSSEIFLSVLVLPAGVPTPLEHISLFFSLIHLSLFYSTLSTWSLLFHRFRFVCHPLLTSRAGDADFLTDSHRIIVWCMSHAVQREKKRQNWAVLFYSVLLAVTSLISGSVKLRLEIHPKQLDTI